ncbi:hypothetical protein BDW42DRAFT_191949 [Aspergillus taichungensis]|uniref:P-loop containing nucleoside triphosphate hydrolase protein n=1 Tax=Aspergillus taichungensis TaxID=482145 RepID=A0A2J5I2N2_9EURO|nr:hypothetical protein BDW42DRAFT_191949 [Aspergillus taichungensis]
MNPSSESAASSECECPCSIRSATMGDGVSSQSEYDTMFKDHLDLLTPSGSLGEPSEAYLAPIVTGSVLSHGAGCNCQGRPPELSQFGLLAGVKSLLETTPTQEPEDRDPEGDPRLLLNVSMPSNSSRKAFRAASQKANVEHLTTKGTYSRFNVRVEPLEIDQKHLNTKRMLDLMAVGQNDGPVPLYIHTVKRILRNMRLAQQETGGGFDYQQFKRLITSSGLTPAQIEPLNQRLETLESFMPTTQSVFTPKKKKTLSQNKGTQWEPSPGRLTIVDLSCPCISAETACSLFDICLSIFLEQSADIGRVVALDEAHKYMNGSIEARLFTETLLSTVRLQRHLAARIIISTQEPTISKSLLDLCSTTIVHRFTSPEWLQALKSHLAAASTKHLAGASSETTPSPIGENTQQEDVALIFDKIVSLRVGEALLFSPSAVISSMDDEGRLRFGRLGSRYLAMKVRARLTLDGGMSVLSNARQL